MRLLKLYFFISIISILAGCGQSPMNIWLDEYEVLLNKGIHTFAIDPTSEEMRQIQYQIAEKEAEVDGILRNASMQEQMSFLSKYYDMRIQFYYAVQ